MKVASITSGRSHLAGLTRASRWSALAVVLGLAFAPAARAEWPFTMASPDKPAAAEVTAVRVYKLAGAAREKASPWDLFGSASGLVIPELLAQIASDAQSDKVRTLIMKFGQVGLGPAQAEELATALAAARKANKRVVVYLGSGDLVSLVASAPADLVAMTPESSVFAPGLQAEVSFYKDLLGTIGVEADIESVGQYKSAMEPYTRTSLSDAARENLEALIDGLYKSLVAGIGGPRKMDLAKVEAAIDKGLLTAEQAKSAGLIDELRYWGELLETETKAAGGKDTSNASVAWPIASATPELGSLFDIFKLISGDSAAVPETEPKIAVLVAEGPIVEGRDPSDFMNNDNVIATEDFLDELHAIENDPMVKALVVRIDSPGGSALASDLIWRELERVGKKLPVIASMGNVAASGGYYIAAAAKKIYADATTLTGSIGVFGGKMVYGGMLEKLGVHTVVIARGKNAGMFSGLTRFSDSEREVMRTSMQHTYKTFVNRVAKGRSMSFDAVDKIAQGRVWTGKQALEVGLVDKLGGLDEAVREAARMSKAWPTGAEPKVQLYPKKQTLIDLLGKSSNEVKRLRFGGQLMTLAKALPAPIAGSATRLARVVESLVGDGSVLAMLPMAIELR